MSNYDETLGQMQIMLIRLYISSGMGTLRSPEKLEGVVRVKHEENNQNSKKLDFSEFSLFMKLH